MKCTNCGAELEEGATICPVCFATINKETGAQDTPTENALQSPAETSEAVSEPNEPKESKEPETTKPSGENESSETSETLETTDAPDGSDEPGAAEETDAEGVADKEAEDFSEHPADDTPVLAFTDERDRDELAVWEETKKENRRGIRTYAIVMTACFAVSFLILLATLLTDKPSGGGSGTQKVVYIREGELVDDDTLSTNEIAELGKPSVVAVSIKTKTGSGVGTGIIMSEDGYIATNYLVIEGATTVQVRLYDETTYEAEVIGSSEIDDLAVLKIAAHGLKPAKFGDSSEALVGDRVVVIGHPAGLEFGWTTTQGIISANNRVVKIKDSAGTLTKKLTLLQTDANVNSGNSGGPMFNAKGEVIGIISMKLSNGYEGMGFAIPINGAMELLNAIIETGSADGIESSVSSGRPVLGITAINGTVTKGHFYILTDTGMKELTEEEAAVTEDSFVANATGVLVTGTTEGTDAHGKVLPKDVIIGINGRIVTSFRDLQDVLYDCDIGETVSVSLVRGDETLTVKINLGAAKDE